MIDKLVDHLYKKMTNGIEMMTKSICFKVLKNIVFFVFSVKLVMKIFIG